MDQYRIPGDLLYTREHEWAKRIDGTVRVGITDYAAKTLNDIVYLSLPQVNQTIEQHSTFGTVESIKAVSELYSPISGTVVASNVKLVDHPELVNQSPYEDGWIIEIKPSKFDEESAKLLTSDQYKGFLESLAR